MDEKRFEISVLLDIYAPLLSDRHKELLDLYYNEDLSLSEIAESAGITRQGVRDSIAKARVQLTGYEEKLGLAAKFRAIEHTLGEIIPELTRLRDSADGEVRETLDTIIKKVGTITI